ncbi:hypothetical protein SDC9_52976 [bioreactor metagenome]|uniref:Uncharacterized protein n=1 Tax=bioreactor metagenome TaxID=1076179 RepID=A0A644WXB4_9ZZZZ
MLCPVGHRHGKEGPGVNFLDVPLHLGRPLFQRGFSVVELEGGEVFPGKGVFERVLEDAAAPHHDGVGDFFEEFQDPFAHLGGEFCLEEGVLDDLRLFLLQLLQVWNLAEHVIEGIGGDEKRRGKDHPLQRLLRAVPEFGHGKEQGPSLPADAALPDDEMGKIGIVKRIPLEIPLRHRVVGSGKLGP